MFTGLISDVGTITAINTLESIRRVMIECSYDIKGVALGASIACDGACLTVVHMEKGAQKNRFVFDISPETLARTTLGHWKVGTRVNMERSLRIGDELGGHIVTGHVDAVGIILAREDINEVVQFDLAIPQGLHKFVAEKGSITLDGTSLTVNNITSEGCSVMLIPHTLEKTTWGSRQVGDQLNIEVDLMARYAARLTQTA